MTQKDHNMNYIDILPKLDASTSIVARDFICPECGDSGVGYPRMDKPRLVGWCDTEWGYMMVAECPKCFTKYRFHGTTDNKKDLGVFEHAIKCYILSRYFSNSEELESKAD